MYIFGVKDVHFFLFQLGLKVNVLPHIEKLFFKIYK